MFYPVAAEISRLQSEISFTKNEKETLTKSHEKLQQKAGQQVCMGCVIIQQFICLFAMYFG